MMGTLLKYLFYAVIILAIYFIGAGFYKGTLTGDSKVSEVAEHVTSETGKTIKDGYDATKDAISNGVNEVKTETKEVVRDVE